MNISVERLDITEQEKRLLNAIIHVERIRSGYKQIELEHICSRATLNKIEKNKCIVNDDLYDELLKFSGTSFDYSHSCFEGDFKLKLDKLYEEMSYYNVDTTKIIIDQLIMELIENNGVIEQYYLDILIAVREQFFYDKQPNFEDCEYLLELIPYLPEPMKTNARYLMIQSSGYKYLQSADLIEFTERTNLFDEDYKNNPILRSEYLDYLFLTNKLLSAYDFCKDSIRYYRDNGMVNRQCDMYKRLLLITLNSSSNQMQEVIESVNDFLLKNSNCIAELKKVQVQLQLGIIYFKFHNYEATYEVLKNIDLVKYKKVLPHKIMMNYSLEKLNRYLEFDYDSQSLDEYRESQIDIYNYFKIKHTYLQNGEDIDYDLLEQFVLSHKDSFTITIHSVLSNVIVEELKEIMQKTKKYWLKRLIQI